MRLFTYAGQGQSRLDQPAMCQAHVNAAFRGAEFHLHRIESILKHPDMKLPLESDSVSDETKRQIRGGQNAIVWHTRGYFWELSAMWDNLLRWANVRYRLGVQDPYGFKWDGKRKSGLFYVNAQLDADEWAGKREIINGIWNAEWFQNVRAFRNYSHEGVVPHILEYQCEAKGEGKFEEVNFSRISLSNIPKVTPQFALDLPAQLRDYLTKMGTEAAKIFPS